MLADVWVSMYVFVGVREHTLSQLAGDISGLPLPLVLVRVYVSACMCVGGKSKEKRSRS